MDIDIAYADYAYLASFTPDTTTAGQVVFKFVGKKLPSTFKGYYKETSGNTDWVGGPVSVVQGEKYSAVDNMYNYTITIKDLKAGIYDFELFAYSDVEMYNGTVKAGKLLESASSVTITK